MNAITPASTSSRPARSPGLDSLRGLAVVAVVAYHLGFVPGGFLGVDIFFVLSGYLVTALALREIDRTGRLGIRAFWGRRVRRLAPALFVMVPAVLAVAVWVGWPRTAADALAWDAGATLTWWANWRQAFGADGGYWSTTPSLFRHAWSLAIEEQFYALWPLVLTAGLLVARRLRWSTARTIGVIAGTLAAASTAWSIVLAHRIPAEDLSRVYVGTDTRILAPLIGCALACAWPLGGRPLSVGQRRSIQVIGVAAIAVLAAAMTVVEVDAPQLYRRGGFVFIAGLAAIALVGASTLHRTDPATTWLGHRSYAIYLWSWPIQVLAEHRWPDISRWTITAIVIPLSLVLAEVSWHLIEHPAQRRLRWAARPAIRRTVGAGMVAASVAAVIAIAAIAIPPPAHERISSAAAAELALAPPPSTTAPPAPSTTDVAPDEPDEPAPESVLLLGDSVAFTAGMYAPRGDDLPEGVASIDSRAIIGCGLLSGDHQWPSASTGEWVAPAGGACVDLDAAIDVGLSGEPDVVLIMPGAWEHSALLAPDGTTISAQSPEMAAALTTRLHHLAERAATAGARTVLVPWACPGPDSDPNRLDPTYIHWIGGVLDAAAEAHPTTTTAPLPPDICEDDNPTAPATEAKNRAMQDEVHVGDAEGGRWVWHEWLGPSIRSTRPTPTLG